MRLARAVHLSVRRTGPGRYAVTGGSEPHTVTVGPDGRPSCDCADFAMRGESCKHIVACRLRRGDPATLDALRVLVPLPKRRRRRATTSGAAA